MKNLIKEINNMCCEQGANINLYDIEHTLKENQFDFIIEDDYIVSNLTMPNNHLIKSTIYDINNHGLLVVNYEQFNFETKVLGVKGLKIN